MGVVVGGFVLLGACGGGDADLDGGTDDAAEDTAIAIDRPEIPWLADGVPPLAFTPCPDGWREVTTGGATTCDPYPEEGAHECPFGEAHFPGEPDCAPIGDPCPAGDWADALPTDTAVTYVKAGAPATGANGTIDAPYPSLDAVPWLSLTGATVALAKGTYEGTMALGPGTRVIGACVAETRLTGTTVPGDAVVTVTRVGEPAYVRNLAVVVSSLELSGLAAQSGQQLEIEGVLVDGVDLVGIGSIGAGSRVTARSVVVRRTVVLDETRPAVQGAGGVVVVSGGSFEASRLLVEESAWLGLFVIEGTVVVTDTVVRGTLTRVNDGVLGHGVHLESDSRLEANRLLVEDNRDLGIFASMSEVVLRDAIVRRTRESASESLGGRGLDLEDGARLDASRLLVDDNREVGIYADASEVLVTDGVVRRTRERARDGKFGRGLNMQEGSRFETSGLLVDDNRADGIFVDGGESTLTDVVVRGTGPQANDLTRGVGLWVDASAILSGRRIHVAQSHEFGIVAVAGVTMELTGVAVDDVERSASGVLGGLFGHAVGVIDATVRLDDFRIRDAETCGVLVAPLPGGSGDATLDLSSGIVERTAIGACVQVDGYDLTRLQRDVRYLDNGVNFDSTSLPVPQSPGALGP